MTAQKKRLTPHQKFYLERLTRRERWAPKDADGYLSAASIGGVNVWWRLREKGWVEIVEKQGPRGGWHAWVRLTRTEETRP